MLNYTIYRRLTYSLTIVVLRYTYNTYCTTFWKRSKSQIFFACSQRIINGIKWNLFPNFVLSIISFNKWMHSVCLFEFLSMYCFDFYESLPRSSLSSFSGQVPQWNNRTKMSNTSKKKKKKENGNRSLIFQIIPLFFLCLVRSNFCVQTIMEHFLTNFFQHNRIFYSLCLTRFVKIFGVYWNYL